MPMKKPPHPGRQIKTALQGAGMNITEGAKHLGVTRNTPSREINGLARISPKMAIRLSSSGVLSPLRQANDQQITAPIRFSKPPEESVS